MGERTARKWLVARAVSAYQSSKQVVYKRRVLFYKSTALLYGSQQNGQQVADKMRHCQRVVAIL